MVGDLPPAGVSRLLRSLTLDTASGQHLAAGPLQARLYTGTLAGADGRAVSVVLVPSEAGASAAICIDDGRNVPGAVRACRTALTSTVELRGSASAPAAPAAPDAAALHESLARLNAARGRDAARLAAAATNARQANAAELLSADYARAQRELSAISFTVLAREPGERLIGRLVAGATGYQALARAADARSAARFRAASSQIRHADAGVKAALADLAALGYTGR
jgi:hypothetical protein